jgi:hypothetical protein
MTVVHAAGNQRASLSPREGHFAAKHKGPASRG